MKLLKSQKVKLKAKRTFLKKGTCSRTFFYILNREFGYPKDTEECAIDPLAGGILQQGYQCGMLWGSSMALGAEAYRRTDNKDKAIGITIKATQHVMESFVERTKTIECEEITKCDFSSKASMAKYMLTGKFLGCFKLAGKWAPEAIEAAEEGLANRQNDLPNVPLSCASEVIKKMGGTDEQMVMVAGFAGGLGLSGNGCGALSAAIWKKTFDWCKKENPKSAMKNPEAEEVLEKFYAASDYEIECSKISGKCFKSIDEHTEFIKNGGCNKLIKTLAQL